MRKTLIAGNWKMNLSVKDSISLVKKLKAKLNNIKNTEILVCPSFTALKDVNKVIKGSNISLGAQNVCYEDKGAFTGEISAHMLKEAGCKYVIVGHSERRHIFKETDEMINLRLFNAIENKLKPILCVGETLEQKGAGKTKDIISEQIKKGLKNVKDMNKVVIAYEPVWAIGTGKNASPAQVQEVHVFIRDLLKKIFGVGVSLETRILYGGSVKPDNIQDLMMQSDIDGALVGGASLKTEDFSKIVKF